MISAINLIRSNPCLQALGDEVRQVTSSVVFAVQAVFYLKEQALIAVLPTDVNDLRERASCRLVGAVLVIAAGVNDLVGAAENLGVTLSRCAGDATIQVASDVRTVGGIAIACSTDAATRWSRQLSDPAVGRVFHSISGTLALGALRENLIEGPATLLCSEIVPSFLQTGSSSLVLLSVAGVVGAVSLVVIQHRGDSPPPSGDSSQVADPALELTSGSRRLVNEMAHVAIVTTLTLAAGSSGRELYNTGSLHLTPVVTDLATALLTGMVGYGAVKWLRPGLEDVVNLARGGNVFDPSAEPSDEVFAALDGPSETYLAKSGRTALAESLFRVRITNYFGLNGLQDFLMNQALGSLAFNATDIGSKARELYRGDLLRGELPLNLGELPHDQNEFEAAVDKQLLASGHTSMQDVVDIHVLPRLVASLGYDPLLLGLNLSDPVVRSRFISVFLRETSQYFHEYIDSNNQNPLVAQTKRRIGKLCNLYKGGDFDRARFNVLKTQITRDLEQVGLGTVLPPFRTQARAIIEAPSFRAGRREISADLNTAFRQTFLQASESLIGYRLLDLTTGPLTEAVIDIHLTSILNKTIFRTMGFDANPVPVPKLDRAEMHDFYARLGRGGVELSQHALEENILSTAFAPIGNILCNQAASAGR
jgi:hypothetical protein